MTRSSWLDEKTNHPLIQERIESLESFTSALGDGVVTAQEVSGQEQRLVAAMKSVESELSDDVHAKVTALLVEMTAYNVMRLLHELQAERARVVFAK
jgi:hypothetical protein